MTDETIAPPEPPSFRGFFLFAGLVVALAIGLVWLFSGWSTVAPDEAGFSVEMPEKATADETSVLTEWGRLDFRTWSCEPLYRVYLVGFHPLPEQAANLSDRELLAELMEGYHLVTGGADGDDLVLIEAPLPAGEVRFTAQAGWGGNPGTDYRMTKRIYLDRPRNRAYAVIHAVIERESEDGEEARLRFLNSFTLDR